MSEINDEDLSRGLVCEMCGKTLLVDEDVRYIIDIRVYAAYDPMEITEEDLQKDHIAEMQRIIEILEKRDPQEVQDEVFKQMVFHICPDCRKRYLKTPLPSPPNPEKP